jgi:sulfur-carrier protein
MKTLKLFATLRDLAGVRELEVPFEHGQTVRELVETIRDIQPELAEEIVNAEGEMTGLVHILVHGRHTQWLDGLDTVIKDSDVVVLMPPSAGG